MSKQLLVITGIVIGVGAFGGLFLNYVSSPKLAQRDDIIKKEKTIEEKISEAKQKSQNVKGVYMTYDVAADRGKAATRLRENIKKLLQETELNGIVIDVKEAKGTTISKGLKETIDEFHEGGAWVIARMTMFRDNSQAKDHPELYVKRKNGSLWRDNNGHAWFDVSNKSTWAYNVQEIKKAIDLGFDEIQYDYVRFPSDGNVNDIVFSGIENGKQKADFVKGFLIYANRELKIYKPELILSADLFGYVSVRSEDLGIGQKLTDIGDSVDYISFMLYPSHYYAGFQMSADTEKNLPAIYHPYKGDAAFVVSSKPYDVVYRSLLVAIDVLSGKASSTAQIKKNATTSNETVFATSTPDSLPQGGDYTGSTPVVSLSRAHMRPWLQDFDLAVDKNRGIYYDAAKVRAQIQAAEDAGSSGWLLWNSSNIYTVEALKKE